MSWKYFNKQIKFLSDQGIMWLVYIIVLILLGVIVGRTESYFLYVLFYLGIITQSIYMSFWGFHIFEPDLSSKKDIFLGCLQALIPLLLMTILYEFVIGISLDSETEVFGMIWGR